MDAPGIRILIVEHEAGHSEAIRRALEAAGADADIRVVSTLREYRESVAVAAPDVALMDLSLPDGRAVEALTSPPEGGAFPVLIMTSYGDERTAVEAIKAGALDYVVKSPEAFRDMPRTLARALREWKLLQERRHAEEEYRTVVENAAEAIFVIQDGKLVFLNAATSAMSGHSAQELMARPFIEFVHPKDRDMVADRYIRRLKGEEVSPVYAFRIVHPNGTGWVELHAIATTWNGRPATLNFVSNITERKRAEKALRESEEKYQKLVEDASVGICSIDTSGEFTFVNQALCKELGYAAEEALGTPFMQYVHEQDQQRVVEFFPAGLTDPQGRLEFEFRAIRKDGSAVDFYASVTHLKQAENTIGFLVVLTNVTERKRAEQALRESEQRFRGLFEHSPVALWEQDYSLVKPRLDRLRAAGIADFCAYYREHPEEVTRCAALVKAVNMNQATLGLFGASSGEELLSGLGKLFGEGYIQAFAELLVALAQGKLVFESGAAIRTLAGEERQVILRWSLLPGCEETLARVLVSITDITERKRAEEERLELERRLLHSQKLESLGVLAGGIAHDFNNLLMALLGNMELALEDLSPVSSARPRVEQAVVAAKRAADLTRQMLAYSGKGRFDIRAIDLSELVEENAHMLRAAISRNVTFSLQLSKDLPPIEADAGQIQQVVMNLITNASEAIGDTPGVVTLATGVQECDAASLSRSLVEDKPAPGQFVWLEVSDTGGGMDQGTLQRIFDPFFTTKLTGRGLGMSAVHGIVRGHQGAILIDTREGKGTGVRVLFPAAEHLTVQPRTLRRDATQPAQTATVEGEPAGATPAPLLSGTVLVVDDEQMVCDLVAATLTGVGLQVLTAADGMDAVVLFRQHADEVGCVLLDLTMPNMDGVTTLELLRQIRPDVRVILSSGYDEQEATKRFAGRGLSGFLHKPYQLNALRDQVQRVIQAPES